MNVTGSRPQAYSLQQWGCFPQVDLWDLPWDDSFLFSSDSPILFLQPISLGCHFLEKPVAEVFTWNRGHAMLSTRFESVIQMRWGWFSNLPDNFQSRKAPDPLHRSLTLCLSFWFLKLRREQKTFSCRKGSGNRREGLENSGESPCEI